MNQQTITLQRADDESLSYVEALLEANGLPTADVRAKPDCFYVAFDGDPVGIGGLEVDGTDALLRSVVVEQSARGDGVGTALCNALETEAADEGVETLYLLTTTADAFFADRGFVEVERASVPASLRETAQFEELCPSTATCMRKSL